MNVGGIAAQPAGEIDSSTSLGRNTMSTAVVEDGPQLPSLLTWHPQAVIDDDSRDRLPLRMSQDPEFPVVDVEALLLTNLIHPPAESPNIESTLWKRECQIIRVTCVLPARLFGEARQSRIKPPADEIGNCR